MNLNETPHKKNMANWAIEKRYEFCLFWHGRVNRSDLETTFRISTQQASLDINGYHRLTSENRIYAKSKRTYVRGAVSNHKFKLSLRATILGNLCDIG